MQLHTTPRAAQSITLGYDPMDAIHAEFEALLAQAADASDAALALQIDALQAHLQAHFDAEDRWMRATDFPARNCHMDEHAAVLRSAGEVRLKLAAGDTALARRFVAELAHWFPGHADYLDSALAHWMCARQYGGKPVVLQRQPRRHCAPAPG